MSYFSAWQFVRQNAVLVTLFFSGFVALGIVLLLHQLQRKNERKSKMQGLAASWLATLFELSLALDYMQETTRHLIRARQRPSRLETFRKPEIFTHQWLREGFCLMAGDQEGAGLVNSLHLDCDFFEWNLNQTTIARRHTLGTTGANQENRGELQKTIEAFDDATIEFACNRHHGMVGDWGKSVRLLNDFCSQYELKRGDDLVAPGEIPLKWQRNDTKPWTIENLARVGEGEWEP